MQKNSFKSMKLVELSPKKQVKMGAVSVAYFSAEDKTEEQAHVYLQTHQAPHRFLAYRNIPAYIHQYVQGKRALDFGAGTGASSSFLQDLGFDVIGTDVSSSMLEKAQANFPSIEYSAAGNLAHL